MLVMDLVAAPVRCRKADRKPGRVAEWFKAPVLKTGRGATLSWVRIPPRPPTLPFLSRCHRKRPEDPVIRIRGRSRGNAKPSHVGIEHVSAMRRGIAPTGKGLGH